MKVKKICIYIFNCLGIMLTLPFLAVIALVYFKRFDFCVISIVTFLFLITHFLNVYVKEEIKK